jgi:GNAT superfamily N-acetyltransferase
MILREVRDPNDPAIAAFGSMQRAAYFAPETLIPAEYIPLMLGGSGEAFSRHNHLVVAESGGQVVGGTLFHWLASPRVGFSSFMGIDRAFRRRGIARRLHEERFRILDRDAGGRAPGVFIDVVNPTRLSPEELERERRAGSDPWERRRVFEHLGFRQVGLRYEQPVGGPGGGPVTTLDLLFCPRDPTDSIPTALVVSTMRAYWEGWLGDARAERSAAELGARAGGAAQLALESAVPPWPHTS